MRFSISHRLKVGICCLIPIFGIIGMPLLLYGGLNIPSNLTPAEAWAAGTNQLEVLEAKKKASPAYLQMLIGGGFLGTACAIGGVCLLTVICRPEWLGQSDEVVEPDPSPQPSEQV